MRRLRWLQDERFPDYTIERLVDPELRITPDEISGQLIRLWVEARTDLLNAELEIHNHLRASGQRDWISLEDHEAMRATYATELEELTDLLP